MLEVLLEKLGLSEKEAKVYLSLLELGKDTAQNVAKKAGINRPITYVVLEKLMKSGLASSVEEGKKTFFVASNPNELETLLNKQDRELHSIKEQLKLAMNEFTAIYNAKQDKPRVLYFEGADGLQAMDRIGRSEMNKNSEILSLSPIDLINKYFPDRRQQALSERVKLGIRARTIYTNEGGEIPEMQNKKELREGIFVPRDKFPLNGIIRIVPDWGIKLYYIDLAKPFGVVIQSKELAQNMQLMFDLAWVGAKSKGK